MEVQNNVGKNEWDNFLKSQHKHTNKKFQFEDFVFWFPKGEKTHLGKFKKRWFIPIRLHYCLPDNTILVSVNNYEPNPVLINVNNLKPYRYVNQTLKAN